MVCGRVSEAVHVAEVPVADFGQINSVSIEHIICRRSSTLVTSAMKLMFSIKPLRRSCVRARSATARGFSPTNGAKGIPNPNGCLPFSTMATLAQHLIRVGAKSALLDTIAEAAAEQRPLAKGVCKGPKVAEASLRFGAYPRFSFVNPCALYRRVSDEVQTLWPALQFCVGGGIWEAASGPAPGAVSHFGGQEKAFATCRNSPLSHALSP